MLRTETETDHDLDDVATESESDAEAYAEALSKLWHELSDKARRLVTFYLVKEVHAGSPALPIDEQFRITWRFPPGRPTNTDSTRGSGSRVLASRRTENSCPLQAQAGRPDLLAEQIRERTRPERGGRLGFRRHPGAVCVLFDRLMLGDTFWPEEFFVRKVSAKPQ
ncbi:hypothetical protein [Actinokineospora sp. UTMC 2448]|uniref:hypothetical protein n=1 Tax=Actinokineospora sp. UTMC 2448 TaxID=2268449 RepID=UPI00216495A1|nr:hypothetical protein [Actinokineospora sp. UTMC 2448]UVS78264.1 hypothetical protein Actkin_01992 [Actinokineospora sp. UTMC 2448]